MKKLNDSRSFGLKGAIVKFLAVIMCVSVFFGLVVTSTGCSFIDNITDGLNVNSNNLSETDLARLITNAIINERSVGDSYEKIPKTQLDGLSYSMFSEYCAVLRKCSNEHGTVDSFRILNESEKERYFLQINSVNDENLMDVGVYGNLDVIELCYSEDKAPSSAPVRFVITKNGNKCLMASKYITDCMLAYSYINHYFDMIDDHNIDALEAIIKSTYNSDIYMNSVIRAKADYIADYYRLKVKTIADDYELKLFSPTHIVFEIPEVFTVDGGSIISKRVELYLQRDGSYNLIDKVPVMLSELRFYMNGQSKLRMGSVYTPNEINSLIGKPIVSTYIEGAVILAYNGMTLTLETEDAGADWTTARLTSIALRKDDVYTFGEDIYIGMNISELLLIYPMFDESDYVGSFKNGDGEFVLSFEFDDYGNVTRVKLGEALG
ncbi:MAG: hypothetical protein IKO15_10170 [Clostridiales bacterium]|nr:hypothetical protein [Clostridiales bacterium]